MENRYYLSRRDGELLRITASVMVVIAHCIHVWVREFYNTRDLLSLGAFATVLDQITRFTVPAFLFLSGFGLTRQFLSRPPSLAGYYRSRMLKIMAPFFLWSALTSMRHIGYFAALPWEQAPGQAAGKVLYFLFVRGFDYQYYFLMLVFQFYLVFPFLFRLIRSPAGKWVLGGVLLLQMAFMSPMDSFIAWMGMRLPGLHSHLILNYGFYCLAGMVAARNPDMLSGLLRRWSGKAVLAFWAGALALMSAEFWIRIQSGVSLYNADHFNRWSVGIYCLASLLLLLKSGPWLRRIHEHPAFAFLYTGVAPYTFFVYLFHTHVLRGVDFLTWEVTVWDFASRIFYVVAGSYAAAWLVQWLLDEYPRLRFALGLPKPSLRFEDLPGAAWLASRRGQPRAQRAGTGDLESRSAALEPRPEPAEVGEIAR